jgi:hypothetical protein
MTDADTLPGNVYFAERLVAWNREWLLYVGLADLRLGVWSAPIKQ